MLAKKHNNDLFFVAGNGMLVAGNVGAMKCEGQKGVPCMLKVLTPTTAVEKAPPFST